MIKISFNRISFFLHKANFWTFISLWSDVSYKLLWVRKIIFFHSTTLLCIVNVREVHSTVRLFFNFFRNEYAYTLQLSLFKKIGFLKQSDDLPKMGQWEAAARLGIPQSSLCKLLKNRYELEVSFINNDSTLRKWKCNGKDEDVENALKKWFTSLQEKDGRVNSSLLKI